MTELSKNGQGRVKFCLAVAVIVSIFVSVPISYVFFVYSPSLPRLENCAELHSEQISGPIPEQNLDISDLQKQLNGKFKTRYKHCPHSFHFPLY